MLSFSTFENVLFGGNPTYLNRSETVVLPDGTITSKNENLYQYDIDLLFAAGVKDGDQESMILDPSTVNRYRTGAREVAKNITKLYEIVQGEEDVVSRVKETFSDIFLCRISHDLYPSLIRDIKDLYDTDFRIPDENKARWNSLANTDDILDFLAEVYVYAIKQPCRVTDGLPSKMFGMPSRNPNFTGRDKIISEIYHDYNSGRNIQLLYGISGIGKTSIAIEYAYRYADSYNQICLLDCTSYESLVNSYKQFLIFKNAIKGLLKEENIISIFKSYFNKQKDYLLIYDNIRSQKHAECPQIAQVMPDPINGDVLLVTRNKLLDQEINSKSIHITAWDKDESAEYLRKILINQEKISNQDISKITERLSNNPAAIEYASKYINKLDLSCNEFLTRLDEYGPNRVLTRKPGKTAHDNNLVDSFTCIIEELKKDAHKDNNINLVLETLYFAAFWGQTEPFDLALHTYSNNLLEQDDVIDILEDYSLCEITGYGDNRHVIIPGLVCELIEPLLPDNYYESMIQLLFPELFRGMDYNNAKIAIREVNRLKSYWIAFAQKTLKETDEDESLEHLYEKEQAALHIQKSYKILQESGMFDISNENISIDSLENIEKSITTSKEQYVKYIESNHRNKTELQREIKAQIVRSIVDFLPFATFIQENNDWDMIYYIVLATEYAILYFSETYKENEYIGKNKGYIVKRLNYVFEKLNKVIERTEDKDTVNLIINALIQYQNLINVLQLNKGQ